MKYIITIIIAVGLCILAWIGYQRYQNTQLILQNLTQELDSKNQELSRSETLIETIQVLEEKLHDQQESQQIYHVIAGGDIMLDRGVEKVIDAQGGDYSFPFALIGDYLQGVDLVFANLEGSLSDTGVDQGNKYSFRFDVPAAQAMSDAGIDIVSLANNHMLDWGRDSLCATMGHLADVDIASVGAGCNTQQAEEPYIVTLGDTRIAFLAYTEFHTWAAATDTSPGMSEYSMDNISRQIKRIKEDNLADIVMVSIHWGEEYLDRAPDRIVALGHEIVDLGADVIIGHHPHVDQEIERYRDGWILYSLGNFVFDQSWSVNTMQGLLADIKIQDKQITDIQPIPIQLNNNYQPYVMEKIQQ